GPLKSYAENGFGLYRVGLKESDAAMGICGLIKRETLTDPDIGFAFLPEYWNQGYAYESAEAVMQHARAELGLGRILAITSPDNDASGKLLGRIGLRFQRVVRLSEDTAKVKLFASDDEAKSS